MVPNREPVGSSESRTIAGSLAGWPAWQEGTCYGRSVAPERLIAFAAVAVLLIAVPGPSVLFIVSRAVSFGRHVALLAVLGNSVGEAGQVALVALGVGELLERSALALSAMRLVGAAYLLYLGYRAFTSRSEVLPAKAAGPPPASRWRAILDGSVVGVTNPKTAVFFVTVLPAFVTPGKAAVPLQILTLGAIWVAIALVSDSLWGVAAARAGVWLRSAPRRRTLVQRSSGIVTAGLGVGLVVSGLRS
jgi:threonine/homoserine/homoserine lactone efflux protein